MKQRRLRVAKWLSINPAVGVCTLCGREFKVPMSALRRTADAQSSLHEQFDRHKCEPEGSSEAHARGNADLLLLKEPDEEEDEAEDDRK
jgi:transcription elongation factor Elf1